MNGTRALLFNLIEKSSHDDFDAEFDRHVALSGTKHRKIWVVSYKMKENTTRGKFNLYNDWSLNKAEYFRCSKSGFVELYNLVNIIKREKFLRKIINSE